MGPESWGAARRHSTERGHFVEIRTSVEVLDNTVTLECGDERVPWKKYAVRLCSIELESASGRWEALQGAYEAVSRSDRSSRARWVFWVSARSRQSAQSLVVPCGRSVLLCYAA